MAGKEKENMKRKGKQRLVGEMAIRWIATSMCVEWKQICAAVCEKNM